MPPGNGRNRIGLGIGYDDPGDSTLRYLREVNGAARELMRTFKEMGTVRIEIPTMPQAGMMSQQSVAEQKHRITDVANHQIAEGRRAADVTAQIAAKSNEELKRMALVFQSGGYHERAEDIRQELARRSGGQVLGQNLSAEEQRLLEQARNPDPNRYYFGKGQETRQTTTPPPTRVIPTEGRALTPEEEAGRIREEAIRSHILRQQRQEMVRQWQFEQQSTRTIGSVLGEKEVGRGEVDVEFEKRERRRQLNERINERYEQQQRQAQQAEALERAHAAEMQRRTQEAETAATARGYRTPEEQGTLEQGNMRAYQQRYGAIRAARQQRANQQEIERQREEYRVAEEARIQQAEAERPRREAAAAERDRQIELEQRRRDQEAARQRVERRDTQRAYEGQARYAGQQQAGPEVPEEVRLGNVEAQKKAQNEIRTQVRQSQQTFAEFSKEASGDLDKITQKSSQMASQFTTNSRRYHGQMQQDARQTAGAFNTIFTRAEALREELARPTNMRRSTDEIRNELTQLREQMEATIRESNRLKMAMAEQGQDQVGANSPFRRGIFGLGAGGGFGTVTARLIEYGAIYKGVQAFKDLTKASLESAEAQAQATNELANASRQAGLLASENERIVQSIQGQGAASRTQAMQITSASQRFATTAGLPGRTGDIATIMGNIAASRGMGNDKLAQMIDQAQHEQGRFAEEYLGSSPDEIYRNYVRRHRTDIEAGFQDVQKGTRTIQQDVSSLTDMEKRRALIEEIERKQGQFAGAMNDRLDTQAGKMERVKASWDNMTSSMGNFIASSSSISTILDWIAEKMGGIKGPDQQPGGGPGGLLNEADIRARAAAGTAGGGALSATASVPFREVAQLGGIGSLIYHLFGGGPVTAGDIPLVGPVINAKRAQNEGNELEQNLAEDQLRRQNMARFLQLQQAGRVIYRGAGGREYTQQQLNALPAQERGAVMSNFNFGNASTYRIESEKEYNDRMQKVYDERIKTQREMLRSEQEFNDQLGHRVNALGELRQKQLALPQMETSYGQSLAGANPFVAPMTQMETATERVRQQWGGFSREVQGSLVQIETANGLFDIQKARLDNILVASHEITQAKRLELSLNLELTGQEERRLRVNEAQAQAALRVPRLLVEANRLERGFSNPNEQRNAFQQTISNLLQLQGGTLGGYAAPQGHTFTFPGGIPLSAGSQVGRRQQEIAGRAIRQLVQGIPEQMLFSNDPTMKQLRLMLAEADRNEAGNLLQNVRDEQRRAQVGDLAAQEAQGLVTAMPQLRERALAQGRARGLTGAALESYTQRINDYYRSQVLATTGALGEKELTPELRKASIDALREDAAARLRQEQQAQAVRQQTMMFTAQILAEIQAFRKAIGQAGTSGYEVAVKVENQTQARIDEKSLKELQTGFVAQQNAKQNKLDMGSSFGGVPTVP